MTLQVIKYAQYAYIQTVRVYFKLHVNEEALIFIQEKKKKSLKNYLLSQVASLSL